MTCIVGLVTRRGVYIGGDSAGVAGYSLTVRRDRKVFRNGEYLIGFTSSFRMGQLLEHAFTPPKSPPRRDALAKFMCTKFVDALRTLLKERGCAETENGQESGGTFLVAVRGRLFAISDDYQVGEAVDSFNAVGCGAELALGALYATGRVLAERHAEQRVRLALEAAERGSAGVRRPFYIQFNERKT